MTNDYRINWAMPAVPLGPAIKRPVEKKPCPIAAFETGSHSAIPEKAKPAAEWIEPPEGWNLCGRDAPPPILGWYEVGAPNSKYKRMNIRAWWDGQEWIEHVGMIDPSVSGRIKQGQAVRGGMAWRGSPLDAFPAYVAKADAK
jgi:hypothetical protein